MFWPVEQHSPVLCTLATLSAGESLIGLYVHRVSRVFVLPLLVLVCSISVHGDLYLSCICQPEYL